MKYPLAAVAAVLLAFAGHSVHDSLLRAVVQGVQRSVQHPLQGIIGHPDLRRHRPGIRPSAQADARKRDRPVKIPDEKLYPAEALEVERLKVIHALPAHKPRPGVEVRIENSRCPGLVGLVHQHLHHRPFRSIDGEIGKSYALLVEGEDAGHRFSAGRSKHIGRIPKVMQLPVAHRKGSLIHGHVEVVFGMAVFA